MNNQKWTRNVSAVAAGLLSVAISVLPASADPDRKYDVGHYTLRAHETMSFTVRYNGGEWGDAKAWPDNRTADNYDDIEMKVVGDYGWAKVLEKKDSTHVVPHCHWWVGALYGDGLDYIIKITNNESHSVGFSFQPY